MRYDRSPILRERVACGGTNSSEFFAFDTSQVVIRERLTDCMLVSALRTLTL